MLLESFLVKLDAGRRDKGERSSWQAASDGTSFVHESGTHHRAFF